VLELTLYLVIQIFLFLLAILCKRSKGMYIAIALFIWIMAAFATDSYDISNYRYTYDADIYIGKDPLFYQFQLLFTNCNAPFMVFKFAVATITVLASAAAIPKYTEYVAFLSGLCLFIPYGSYITQIRSSMSGAIDILAVAWLYTKTQGKVSWKEIIKYVILIVIASGFHQSSLLFLLLVIPFFTDDKNDRYIKICENISIVLVIIFLVASGRVYNFIDKIQGAVSNVYFKTLFWRIEEFFSSQFAVNFTGFMFNVCHHFVVFICAELTSKTMQQIAIDEQDDEKLKRIILLRKFNASFLFLIPFYSVSYHFVRAFYYASPLLYSITINNVFEIRNKKMSSKYGQIELVLLISVTLFVALFNISKEPSDAQRIVNGLLFWGKN